MESSSLVIKVKYGDTLRRFTARVNWKNHLDLDMAGLRAKILSLFNLASDANMVLRYVDEDGDLVTLGNDDDLHDVTRQRLNFLRIDVHIINESGGKSNASSSGSATPLRSPPDLSPSSGFKAALGPDAFKSVPEPLRGSVAKFTNDLLSSSPVAATIADGIFKMGFCVPIPHGQARAAACSSSENGVPKESSSSEARGPRFNGVFSTSNVSQSVEAENATKGGPFVFASSDLNLLPEPLREAVLKSTKSRSTCGDTTSNASQQTKAENVSGAGLIPIDPESMPQPLREAVSKFSIDLLAKSVPAVADLADSISKMGPSLYPYFQAQVAAGISPKNGVPKESSSSEMRDPQPTCVDSTSNAGQQMEAGNVNRGVVAGVAPVDLNIPAGDHSSLSTNVNPISPVVPDGDGAKGKKCADDGFARKGETSGASPNSAIPNNIPTQMSATSSGAFNEHPFSRTISGMFHKGARKDESSGTSPNQAVPINIPTHMSTTSSGAVNTLPFTRNISGMFHKGVRCDGCGVYPITGPRFKSKVKENYDLCSICFNEMGNESGYIRMDRPIRMDAPVHVRAPQFFRGLYAQPPSMGHPSLPHVFKSDGVLKHAKPKLDSRFVLDVNVIDGTMMAPSTAFTKIWRMRNNGTLVWPKGTQLVWIGGDQFSNAHSVYLEVPEEGVPVDKELDVAVDFRAPQLPGRYVSQWRMATPSGQKFGQRVWVHIQVDASLKDSFYDSSQGLNLNIPLDVDGFGRGPRIIDINAQPVEADAFLQHLNSGAPTERVNQMADKQRRQEPENELPVAAAAPLSVSYPSVTLAAPSAVSYPRSTLPAPSIVSLPTVTSAPPSSVNYPIIDLSEMGPALPSDQQSSPVDAQSSSLGIGGNNPVEETLLKELEEMGFKQVDLNKEILRMNEYDMEQSVDDLCGVSEWDPMLEELHEMGFRDNEMNKRLLKKNNGSIKRVVMELINGGE